MFENRSLRYFLIMCRLNLEEVFAIALPFPDSLRRWPQTAAVTHLRGALHPVYHRQSYRSGPTPDGGSHHSTATSILSPWIPYRVLTTQHSVQNTQQSRCARLAPLWLGYNQAFHQKPNLDKPETAHSLPFGCDNHHCLLSLTFSLSQETFPLVINK